MNYLAHLYLSGNDADVLFGNFIADHVKGSNLSHYPAGIQSGIKLHRLIDAYTDTHAETAAGKKLLYPFAGRYAAVAIDIIFDHFLARNWNSYHNQDLQRYTQMIYALLDERKSLMPERTVHMYAYMKRDNWLGGYAFLPGIERALTGLSRRTRHPEQLAKALMPSGFITMNLNGYFFLFSLT